MRGPDDFRVERFVIGIERHAFERAQPGKPIRRQRVEQQ